MSGTLLFSGTDLATLCDVEDLSDFWSSTDVRGDLPTAPGVNGSSAVDRPWAGKVCSGQVTIVEDTLAAAEDAVAALKTVLRLGRSQIVTRRKITGGGNLDATQTGIVRTAEERWLNDVACTLLLGVELLDGVWYGDSVNIASAAGTQDIDGDVPTSRMTIDLPAGVARTVTNTTNGYSFTFTTGTPTGGTRIDVEAQTATNIVSGADVSQYLEWSKLHPFRLEPGSNVITVSAATASIDYQPAYQ